MRLARSLCVSVGQCGNIYVGLTILFLAGPALLDESKVDLISVLKNYMPRNGYLSIAES